LPYKIGYLALSLTDTEKGSYNYQHYKDTGEKINIKNLHSNRKKARFILGKDFSSVEGRGLFKFRSIRRNARNLAPLIRDENYINKYF